MIVIFRLALMDALYSEEGTRDPRRGAVTRHDYMYSYRGVWWLAWRMVRE